MNKPILFQFDSNNKESIYNYAKGLCGWTMADLIDQNNSNLIEERKSVYNTRAKGSFGDTVETELFGIKNNSRPEPDFPDAALELKTTPLKRLKDGSKVAKERLVFSMIDYENLPKETWETSSFLKKNNHLLLIFYLYEPESSIYDFRLEEAKLIELLSTLPKADIHQIKVDWEKIQEKVGSGNAHELSGGDTNYLEACTKSATAKNRRKQYKRKGPAAKPRAFALKQRYLNRLLEPKTVSQKDLFSLVSEEQTIDDLVISSLTPFIGMSETFICKTLGIKESTSKSRLRNYTNGMFGLNARGKIEEFDKADILMKVINLEPNGSLRESISFPVFDPKELVREEWEESEFYSQLYSMRFLFVIFRKTGSGHSTFERYQFWKVPFSDIVLAKDVWKKARKCFEDGKYELLPKISGSEMAHVRPHGSNKKDVIETPKGDLTCKRSFWLNAKYIEKNLLK
jgi:DNA mismatch repair protein MutH